MQQIANIPFPDDLDEIQQAEFTAFRDALIDLEQEWEAIQNGTSIELKKCQAIVEELKQKRLSQANERFQLRKEVIELQFQKEMQRISEEKNKFKDELHDRVMKAFYHSYQTLTASAKEAYGKEFSSFIQQNPIEFPPSVNINEPSTRSRGQTDEPATGASSSECEKDIKKIQELLHSTSKK